MKDDKINGALGDYVKGVSLPDISLEAAKNKIRASKDKRKLYKRITAFASVFACAVLIFAGVLIFKNNNKITYYGADNLKTEAAFFTELENGEYAEYVAPLKKAEYADNAHVDYYLVYDGETLKYIKIDVTRLNDYGREDVSIYIEFTGKKSTCAEFKKYYGLKNKSASNGVEYKYGKEEVAGEWVSSAYVNSDNVKYFFDVESPYSGSLEKYIKMFF